MARLLYCILQK